MEVPKASNLVGNPLPHLGPRKDQRAHKRGEVIFSEYFESVRSQGVQQ